MFHTVICRLSRKQIRKDRRLWKVSSAWSAGRIVGPNGFEEIAPRRPASTDKPRRKTLCSARNLYVKFFGET